MNVAEKIKSYGDKARAMRKQQAETDRKVQELLRKWDQEQD